MARKSEIQYIRLYTDGSAARRVDFETPQRKSKTRLPKVQKPRALVIRLDPVALCGIIVACVMFVLMAVGCVLLYDAQQESLRAEQYVRQLQEQNTQLQQAYESGYDLETVEEMALALGMVPQEQARQETIRIPVEEAQPRQLSVWETIGDFFSKLFS